MRYLKRITQMYVKRELYGQEKGLTLITFSWIVSVLSLSHELLSKYFFSLFFHYVHLILFLTVAKSSLRKHMGNHMLAFIS